MHTIHLRRSRALVVVTAAAVMTLGLSGVPTTAEAAETPPAATITKLSPTSGIVTGGTVVTVTGTGFTGATAVAFGDVPAEAFTVVSSKKITATSPALTAGTYALSVTTAAGTVTGRTYTVRTFEDEVLRLVNKARASKRKCGSTTYKAKPALKFNKILADVAAAHSVDMATNNYFDHDSQNGDSPFDRMSDAGYRYSSAGENIAAGFASPASVMKGWLKSPGHCKNIMRKQFTELGVGFATGTGRYHYYWTQDFGRPR